MAILWARQNRGVCARAMDAAYFKSIGLIADLQPVTQLRLPEDGPNGYPAAPAAAPAAAALPRGEAKGLTNTAPTAKSIDDCKKNRGALDDICKRRFVYRQGRAGVAVSIPMGRPAAP